MMKLFTLALSALTVAAVTLTAQDANSEARWFIGAYHNVDTKPAAGPQ